MSVREFLCLSVLGLIWTEIQSCFPGEDKEGKKKGGMVKEEGGGHAAKNGNYESALGFLGVVGSKSDHSSCADTCD